MTSYILTGVTFIVILGLLVFVHELGHYSMAKKAGMKVEEFGFGLPPRLYKWKKWNTLWTLNAIPIGGFVRVKGGDSMNVSDKDLSDKENYHSKSWWQRFWFIIAGVIMNFLLAIVLIAFGYMISMQPLPGTSLYENARDFKGVVIGSVLKGSPAEKAGFISGDVVISVNNEMTKSSQETSDYINANKDSDLAVTITRNNLNHTIYVKPGSDGRIGVSLGDYVDIKEVKLPIHKALYYATLNTYYIAKETFFGLIMTVSNLVTRFSVPDGVSGPVGIVTITHKVIQFGFVSILQFAAILSISLGVLNIFPFPALDGGRLLFLSVEAVLRKRIDSKLENYTHLFGFALLMLLILAITYKDIVRLF